MELERDVESYLGKLVRTLSGEYIKVGYDGWPDRLILAPGGKSCWVELKREGGVLAPLQQMRIAQLQKVGQQVVVCWSKEEAEEIAKAL